MDAPWYVPNPVPGHLPYTLGKTENRRSLRATFRELGYAPLWPAGEYRWLSPALADDLMAAGFQLVPYYHPNDAGNESPRDYDRKEGQ